MLALTIAIMVVKTNAGQTNNSSQSKLFMLICIRTINYFNPPLKFDLGTELLDQSSKLWDVIVKHTKALDVAITECRN
jgi:hypothetical protein